MTINYIFRDADGETAKCDSCDFQAPTAEFDWAPASGKHDRPMRLLCEFCSTTMTSRYTEYPAPDLAGYLRAESWRSAACVFNAMKFGFKAGAVEES